MKRKGVTITELVVVLAIIAVMIAIFIPAVQRVREAANEAVCKSNLAQLNLARMQYIDVADLPPTNDTQNVGGWAIVLLPFLEQQNLVDATRLGSPIADVPREFFPPPRAFRCPTQSFARTEDSNSVWAGHYVLVGHGKFANSFADAPLNVSVPWVKSPAVKTTLKPDENSPHNGGYFLIGNGRVEFRAPR